MRLTFASALAVSAALLGGACTKLVPVDFSLVEPCGQENQALNGVISFRMLSNGAAASGGEDNVVAFKANEASGMSIGLGEKIVVTVEGFADDITVQPVPTAPSSTPKAVGRTVPMLIDETTAAVKGNIMVGRVDSFGSPRDVEGQCSTMTAGAAVTGRHGHTVTYIPSLNKVLIFGGAVWASPDGGATPPVETLLKSVEVYDVVTGTFTKLPDAVPSRAYHTATALPNGNVVIWGGFGTIGGQSQTVKLAQIVDVRQTGNPYIDTIDIKSARAHHTATLLADVGLLAIVGGCSDVADDGCTFTSAAGASTNIVPSIEILDVNGDLAKSKEAAGTLGVARAMHQAVGFPAGGSGVIGIIGGLNGTGALRGVEILQVSSGDIQNISSVADALEHGFVRHQVSVFDPANLGFAVTGGQDRADGGVLDDDAPGVKDFITCQLRDARVVCVDGPPLQSERYGHAMARLRDGTLVAIGGVVPNGAVGAEVLRATPGTTPPVFAWAATAGPLTQPRQAAAFALLGGDNAADGFINQVFYSGGYFIDPGTLLPVTSNKTDIFFGP